jgi:hypothetical protein
MIAKSILLLRANEAPSTHIQRFALFPGSDFDIGILSTEKVSSEFCGAKSLEFARHLC